MHEHGRLKRQTGGHGQFADVKIDIAPRERGSGFEFIDKVVGGAVPRNFIPAVGEAAEEAAKKGPFGYPVVDISVTLVDGEFHSVDSSDMAFKTATQHGDEGGAGEGRSGAAGTDRSRDDQRAERFHRAGAAAADRAARADPRVMRSATGWPGWDDVEALVPEAELHDLIIELRSQTLGLGTYRKEFDHLAETRGGEMRRGAA